MTIRKIDIRHFCFPEKANQETKECRNTVAAAVSAAINRHLVFTSTAAASIVASLTRKLVGLTGLEPVTLRLSSACSNQLSYRPAPLRISDRGLRKEIGWIL
jgi:hypothetical protein